VGELTKKKKTDAPYIRLGEWGDKLLAVLGHYGCEVVGFPTYKSTGTPGEKLEVVAISQKGCQSGNGETGNVISVGRIGFSVVGDSVNGNINTDGALKNFYADISGLGFASRHL